MAFGNSHLHFVGGAHGVGHPEKHPGPQMSTVRWEGIRGRSDSQLSMVVA